MSTSKHFLRGMATVNFWAEDVVAARDWYARLFGVDAYFQMPSREAPAYVEFRIGDSEDEFGIIDRRYAPAGMQAGPGGAILLVSLAFILLGDGLRDALDPKQR